MGIKEDIISRIMAIADESSNVNLIAAIGSIGDHVRLAHGKIVKTGAALDESETKKILPTVIDGIASYLNSIGTFNFRKITNVTGSYQVQPDDQIIQVVGTLSAGITITLPLVSAVGYGKVVVIKDKGAIAPGIITPIEVSGISGQLIDGAVSVQMTVQYSCLNVYSDGERWLISSLK